MGFEPGWAGGPGRPAGSSKMQNLLKRMGIQYDPIENLINRRNGLDTAQNEKNEIDQFLTPYFHPKMKQVEYVDSEGNSLLPNLIQVMTPKKDDRSE
jgi:hypothetical protein